MDKGHYDRGERVMGDLIMTLFMCLGVYLFAGLVHDGDRAQECLRANYVVMDGVRFHCVKVDKDEPTE